MNCYQVLGWVNAVRIPSDRPEAPHAEIDFRSAAAGMVEHFPVPLDLARRLQPGSLLEIDVKLHAR